MAVERSPWVFRTSALLVSMPVCVGGHCARDIRLHVDLPVPDGPT